MRNVVIKARRREAGASDMSLILMAIGAAIAFSMVMQFNSCVRDYNRKKNGWVEVDEDYPHDRYQPERTQGTHIDDYN